MRTVAVIGASADSTKYGNKAVRAFKQQGYQVFPVNPKATEIEGLPVFPNISARSGSPQPGQRLFAISRRIKSSP